MPILAVNTGTDYSSMGSALAARGGGYLVANLFGAALQTIIQKHSEGLLICAFIFPAIGMIVFL